MPDFSPVFPILSPLPPLHLEFKNSRHRNEFVHLTTMSCRIHPFCSNVILMRFCPGPSCLGLVHSSPSTTQTYFVLRFPILWWFSPLLFIGILQGIAAGIKTYNFLRAAFIVSLNSSSFGSMKNIPLSCLAYSSFGFSIAHLCFAFFLLHQTYASTYLAIHHQDERWFVSLYVPT